VIAQRESGQYTPCCTSPLKPPLPPSNRVFAPLSTPCHPRQQQRDAGCQAGIATLRFHLTIAGYYLSNPEMCPEDRP